MADFSEVRRIAAALPGTREIVWRGDIFLQVGRKAFALTQDGRVVLKLPQPRLDLLFEARPETFQPCRFGPNRWADVELSHLDAAEIGRLVREAWSTVVARKLSGPVLAAAGDV